MYEVFMPGGTLVFHAERSSTKVDVSVLFIDDYNIDLAPWLEPGLNVNVRINHCSPDPLAAIKGFSGLYPLIEAAGCLVMSASGKYLMIHRRGYWDLPKGKLDEGESALAAAVRETEEECGITGLKVLSPMPTTYHMYFLNGEAVLKQSNWYFATVEGEPDLVPQSSEDIVRAEWMKHEEISDCLPLAYPAIRKLLTAWL